MTTSRWMGVVAVALLCSTAALAQEATPVGRWTTIDDETKKPKSVVAIYEQEGKLYGRIEKLFREPGEEQNPLCDKCDGDMKDKPVIGLVILRGLKKDGKEWTGGKITDPNNGKTYKAKIAVEDGGKRLKVRGFIGFSLLGRTQHWVRATE